MEGGLTSSELAGFGVGTLLLWATLSAPKLDALFSASQRSSLGMCKRCGDLRMIACSRCKGTGYVKSEVASPAPLAQIYPNLDALMPKHSCDGNNVIVH
ncbi:hypothetical protein LWI28_007210 [Acer negundo]|uniref:Uncharacterized protein n=1 Tax=Acer negundo TaxID=4023 RepID=A0AAD5I5T8_ACENE|nr:hypothetical protein LWI28_007210 [Acer negundo]